ncbi:MAG: glycosyltransferase family 2 protein [Bacillota bacterium]
MTARSPLVSIITACYNSEKTLENTLLSVLNQSCRDIQYIVIDGLSSDGSRDIIKKYGDRLGYWVSEKDKGISDAWNKGLRLAEGEIVGIINSDDQYRECAVETAVKALNDNPEAGFVFGDQLIIDEKGVAINQRGDPGYMKNIWFIMPSIPHSTVFVRRRVYERYGGFDITYSTAMDYEFLLRITAGGVRGVYVPSVLTVMSMGGESDLNFVRGYREVMRASVKYGYDSRMALARFYFECLKTYTRKKMQRAGLEAPVRLYRKYIGKRYDYPDFERHLNHREHRD